MRACTFTPSLPHSLTHSSFSFSDHLRQQTVKMTQQLKHQKLTLKSAPPHHLPPLKDDSSKPSQWITRKKSSKSSTSVTLKKEDVCVGMQIILFVSTCNSNTVRLCLVSNQTISLLSNCCACVHYVCGYSFF